jgi:hypothetical protein
MLIEANANFSSCKSIPRFDSSGKNWKSKISTQARFHNFEIKYKLINSIADSKRRKACRWC